MSYSHNQLLPSQHQTNKSADESRSNNQRRGTNPSDPSGMSHLQGYSLQIDLNDAISYNSIIELKNVFLPQRPEIHRFGD
mmetsp:Transcript_23938/g.36651  ORF Transcript_23938/g.36651 Transcript_23938/m.36651 type:complete len:80 (+) Transcript_23938:1276-1515(+)